MHHFSVKAFLFVIGLCTFSFLSADEGIYQQQCGSCHGKVAEGNVLMNAPALNRLNDWYVIRQLNSFQNGQRGNAEGDIHGKTMALMTMSLDKTKIESLASYISKLPASPLVATIKGDIVKGKQYYDTLCGTCHGPGGKGNDAIRAPRMTGLDDWYFVRQYQNFTSGKRGYHAEDRYGRQMKMMSNILPDTQALNDVAAYLQSLQP